MIFTIPSASASWDFSLSFSRSSIPTFSCRNLNFLRTINTASSLPWIPETDADCVSMGTTSSPSFTKTALVQVQNIVYKRQFSQRLQYSLDRTIIYSYIPYIKIRGYGASIFPPLKGYIVAFQMNVSKLHNCL